MVSPELENDYRIPRLVAGGATLFFACLGLTISIALRNASELGSYIGIAISFALITVVLYVLWHFPRRVLLDDAGVHISRGLFRSNVFWPWEAIEHHESFESHGEARFGAHTLNLKNTETGESFGLSMKSKHELESITQRLP